ncbi:hypothetical protein JCM10212_005991 [Sporobolomyces blumeae]
MSLDRQPRAASQAARTKMSPPAVEGNNNNKAAKASSTKATKVKSKDDKKKVTHPPYQEMILEAIKADGTRGAASRPVIKKYILAKYSLADTHQFDSLIAAAIRRGADNGSFDLPKGFTGKIKIHTGTATAGGGGGGGSGGGKVKSTSLSGGKENAAPSKVATMTKTPAAAKPTARRALAHKNTSTTGVTAPSAKAKPVGRKANEAGGGSKTGGKKASASVKADTSGKKVKPALTNAKKSAAKPKARGATKDKLVDAAPTKKATKAPAKRVAKKA